MKSLTSLLLIVIVFAGGFFWYSAEMICPIPIEYRIGVLSSEFGISDEEALSAIVEAEEIWEDTTGLDLFSHNDTARFAINFIFDERQQFTNAEETLSANLREARERNETVEAEYQSLVDQYEEVRAGYDAKRTEYEADLRAYNDEVSRWNSEGGAPEEVFNELNKQKETLDAQQAELNELRQTMNNLVSVINALSDRANNLVDRYNEGVERYNDAFTEGAEFTQGDYRGDHINIYQFSDREELVLVLAHELGHALGIDHVENAASIMYFRMSEQSIVDGLTPEDTAAFVAVCGDGSFFSKLTRIKFW